jgi:dihydroorotate dehydrogenase
MSLEKSHAFCMEMGLISPWMNVAGFLGYLPPAHLGVSEPMGVFLPPPLSYSARIPAANRTAIPYPGGVLLHTTLPNPGLKTAIRQYGNRWSKLHLPVWLRLLPADVFEAAEMSKLADDLENVIAIEVETPADCTFPERLDILIAARGEKPIFAVLPFQEISREFLSECAKNGMSGVVLSAPRGRMKQDGKWVNGRLYGPALYPQIGMTLARFARDGLPLIVGCGVYSIEAGKELLEVGAAALQVDTLLWV